MNICIVYTYVTIICGRMEEHCCLPALSFPFFLSIGLKKDHGTNPILVTSNFSFFREIFEKI